MNKKSSAGKKNPQRKSTLDDLYKQMQESKALEAQGAAQGNAGKGAKKVGKKSAKKTASAKTAPAKTASATTASVRSAQTAPLPPEKQRVVNRAVNKAVNKSRTTGKKKRGSRGGNYSLYYIFAGIVAVIVFAVLAKTVLFNCGSVVVYENQRYTSEQIIEKSGIVLGKSLLDIDTDKARQNIIGSLAYIDDAEVKKSYPTRIEITVKEAERWYTVKQGNRPYIVSRMGKIVDEAVDSSLPVVIGYEALEPAVGAILASEEQGKTDIPAMILAAAEEAQLVGISTIDITDRFEITVVVEDRVTLLLGISTQLENKLHIARELIENEIAATEHVTVNLSNPEKVYVRDNNIIDNKDELPTLPPKETSETGQSGEAAAQ